MKHAFAKLAIDLSVLWMPCRIPGPLNSAIFCQAAAPPGADPRAVDCGQQARLELGDGGVLGRGAQLTQQRVLGESADLVERRADADADD